MGLFRLFRGGASAPSDPLQQSPKQDRPTRRSSGFAELARNLNVPESLQVLDLGPTSPANIQYITNLGHKIYNEDVLLAGADPALQRPGENGKPDYDVQTFLDNNLLYGPQQFDAVLGWDIPDYLPEPLVKGLIDRVHRITRPKGLVLIFFHTRDAGPDAPYYRYHVGQGDALQLQAVWKPGHEPRGRQSGQPMFRLQRVFQNRHIENLFRDFSSLKFFLARDNIREVLAVR